MNGIATRLVAASGAAYVVLAVVGNDVLGADQTGLATTDSRAEHAAALARLGPPTAADWLPLFVEGAGLLAFLVFVAVLWNVLRRADPDSPFPAIAYSAGLASAVVKLASLAPGLAVFYRTGEGWSPQVATALLDLNGFAFVTTWALDGVMLTAVAAVALSTRALSRPLALTAAVLGPLGIVSPLAGNSFGFLPFALTLLWFIGASIGLLRQGAQPRRAVPPEPAVA